MEHIRNISKIYGMDGTHQLKLMILRHVRKPSRGKYIHATIILNVQFRSRPTCPPDSSSHHPFPSIVLHKGIALAKSANLFQILTPLILTQNGGVNFGVFLEGSTPQFLAQNGGVDTEGGMYIIRISRLSDIHILVPVEEKDRQDEKLTGQADTKKHYIRNLISNPQKICWMVTI